MKKRIYLILIFFVFACIAFLALPANAYASEPDFAGTMKSLEGVEMQWSLDKSQHSVLFHNDLPEGDHILVASYDKEGRLLGIVPLQSSQFTVTYHSDADSVKIFWTDRSYVPICSAIDVTRSQPDKPGIIEEGYGIVLDVGSGQNSRGKTTGYLKLLRPDGSAVFEVSPDITGMIYGNIWSNTYVSGSLVRYKTDADGVIVVLEDAAIEAKEDPKRTDSEGTWNDIRVKEDTVIYLLTGSDERKESSYQLLSVSDFSDIAFDSMYYYQNESSFDAVLVKGITHVPPHSGDAIIEEGYGIVLDVGSGQNSSGKTVGYLKLLRLDGSAVFEVSADITGTIQGNIWSNTYVTGSLVRYRSDTDGVIIVLEDAAIEAKEDPKRTDSDGTWNDIRVKDDTVIYLLTGSDERKESSYQLLSVSDFSDIAFDSMYYYQNESIFDAVLVKDITHVYPYSGYAIVLGTDKSTIFGATEYQIKMFMQDGTAKVFSAKKAAYDDNAYRIGSLVHYYLNKNEMILGLRSDFATSISCRFDEDGVCDQNSLTEKTIIFEFYGGDIDDSDNYRVSRWDLLKGADVPEMDYFAESGEFKAIRVEGEPPEEW